VRRLGCGCLSILFLGAFLVGGIGWMARGLYQPPGISPVTFVPADGISAQQKIYDLVGRSTSNRATGQIILSERELNAFLARHLAEVADIPVMGAIVRLGGDGVYDLAVRLPARVVLGETPFGGVLDLSPARWVDRPIWLRLRAHIRVDPATTGQRRYLRLEVDRFYLGRTRLPAVAHRLLLGATALRLLALPLPAAIDDVKVEKERVVIRTGG
jgi:hypothetical protein